MRKIGSVILSLVLLSACGNDDKPKPNIEFSSGYLIGASDYLTIFSNNGYVISGVTHVENEDGSINVNVTFKQPK